MHMPKAFSERRVDDRFDSHSLEITLDGVQYPAVDWSLSGVLVTGYHGPRAAGDEVEGSFRICPEMRAHHFKAVVVRGNPAKGELALNYIDLSVRAAWVLEAFRAGRRND